MTWLAGPLQHARAAQGANEQIEVIKAFLYGRLDDQPSSDYNMLLSKILPKPSTTFKARLYPLVRAIRNFGEKERVCLFPASKSSVKWAAKTPENEVIESLAIDKVSAHLFSRRGEPIYSSVDQLDGKRLAVQIGMTVLDFFETDAQYRIISSSNDLSSVKMLHAGRVDVMFGWYPDVFLIADDQKIPTPQYDPDFILYESTIHLVCKKFEGAENLIDTVNNHLTVLKENGELHTILNQHADLVQ